MTSGIYKIINVLNNRIYIGSSTSLETRKKKHFSLLKRKRHENLFLQNDFNKCGPENFIFEIILETDCEDLLLDFEQNYLDEYWDGQKQCYNINPVAAKPPIQTGNNYRLGKSLTVEHKKLIKEARKFQIFTTDTRKKMSAAQRKRKHSFETKKKISDSNKNRKVSKETKIKISNALKNRPAWNKGKKFSTEIKQKMSESRKGKKRGRYTKKVIKEPVDTFVQIK